MQREEKRATWTITKIVEELEPGESITREELVKRLQSGQAVARQHVPNTTTIRKRYIERVLGEGDDDLLTYNEAADRFDRSVNAIMQGVYRGQLEKGTTFRNGIRRSAVTLASLEKFYGANGK